jgi:transposase-like protein
MKLTGFKRYRCSKCGSRFLVSSREGVVSSRTPWLLAILAGIAAGVLSWAEYIPHLSAIAR